MRRFLLPVVALFCFTGCSLTIDTASRGANTVAGAIEKSEPVLVALEDATGKTLPVGTASTGEKVAKVAGTALSTGSKIAIATGHVEVAALLGGLGTLAGALATFFERRKRKALEKETVA